MSSAADEAGQPENHPCLQVAIDGPAGAGKSTIGQRLAAVLSCPYVDTGLMYRAVTLAALRTHRSLHDGAGLASLAREIRFDLGDGGVLTVNGSRPGQELRSPEVDAAVSEVSAHRELRRVLVEKQRELADRRCVVMVGRDIGTEVLPEAPLKLWVTASASQRAIRRLAEQPLEGGNMSAEQMLALIHARDSFDANRPVSPLRRPEDAVVIETDRLSPEEALMEAMEAAGAAVERLRSCGEEVAGVQPGKGAVDYE